MSIARILTMVVRDLRLGPRSPVFLGMIAVPLVMTFMVQVVLMRVHSPELGNPRLGVADAGRSEMTARLGGLESIQVKRARSPADLARLVRGFDVDVFEGSEGFVECTTSSELCERLDGCVTRDVWAQMYDACMEILESTTLEDMARRAREKRSVGQEAILD